MDANLRDLTIRDLEKFFLDLNDEGLHATLLLSTDPPRSNLSPGPLPEGGLLGRISGGISGGFSAKEVDRNGSLPQTIRKGEGPPPEALDELQQQMERMAKALTGEPEDPNEGEWFDAFTHLKVDLPKDQNTEVKPPDGHHKPT